ncbi:MAG: hypothetical protein AAF213_00220 [Pseudomonadota bacterium]
MTAKTTRREALAISIGGAMGLLMASPQARAFGYTTRPELGEPVGRVVDRRGKVSAKHPALERSLHDGNLVFEKDVITTEEGGYLKIALLSGDEVRIGPMAQVTIQHVVGEFRLPREISFAIEGFGAMRFLPRLEKPAFHPPMRVSIRTPAGTAAGISPDMWAGWLDRAYMVYLTKGSLDVSSLAGQREMRHAGEAIKLRDLNALPPKPFLVRDRQLAKMEAKIRRPEIRYY